MLNIDFSKKTIVTGNQKAKEREYWLNKLCGDIVKSGFHKDFKHAGLDRGKREEVAFQISGDFFSRLEALMNRSDHRLHMILTAGLAALLSKHTGSSDIIVGAPIYKQEIEGEFINTVLALRNRVETHMTFKELLLQVRQTVFEAVEHQNYPIEILLDQLDLAFSPEEFPLFDIVILLENIHDIGYIRHIPLKVIFSFSRKDNVIEGKIEYPASWYEQAGIERIAAQFTRLLETAVFNIDMPLSAIPIVSEGEKRRLLFEFSGINMPEDVVVEQKLLHRMFEEQVEKTPDHTALVGVLETHEKNFNRSYLSYLSYMSYQELNQKSNQLAHFLYDRVHLSPDRGVGILLEPSIDCIIGILAVLKAGGTYVPIDPGLPYERQKHLIRDAGIGVVISQEKYLSRVQCLQWECRCFHTFICPDARDIYAPEGIENQAWLNDKKLWEYVGESAADDISGGGWISSYTGEPLTEEEMAEYSDNIFKKLTPLLHPRLRVLEIGCATGLTMYRLAPQTGFYYGTDLSEVIIRKNRQRVKKEGQQNIGLACLPAHEIDTIDETGFDLVIINSVIQDFYGYNYLRSVIAKAINLVKEKGYLFIGDIMDLALKQDLVREMETFKQESAARGKPYRTKTDWSSELFVSREFFQDLRAEIPPIRAVEFSPKIHTIENELTKFRYDCLITIDKTKLHQKKVNKHKYQYDSTVLQECGINSPASPVQPLDLAYVIYTSGTTGIPNGVLIEHRSASSTIGWFRQTYALGTGFHVLQMANISFDVSLEEIFGTLSQGGALHIAGKETLLDKDRLISYLETHHINMVQLVPASLRTFLADIPKVESLQVVICGGDVLEESLKNTIIAKGYNLYNHYGPTEVTVDAAAGKCNQSPVNIGKPIAGAQAYIVDRSGHLQPIGVPGELLIGGNGLAREYLNNPQKTRETFIPLSEALQSLPQQYLEKLAAQTHEDRVYRSGDIVRWRENGTIEFIGRKDFQVKIRGFRIEPGEIESQLKKHDAIKEAVVTVGDQKDDPYLCAYMVLAHNEIKQGEDTFYIFTTAQQPLLREKMEALHSGSWPAFFAGNAVNLEYWRRLYEVFPGYQVTIIDKEDQIAAVCNSIPLYWNGESKDLPESWDAAVIKGFEERKNNITANTICVLAGVISPHFKQRGMSYQLIKAMNRLTRAHELEYLILPVRPTLKENYPHMSLEEYCNKKQADGLAFDPWLRVHERLGARQLGFSLQAQLVKGTLQQWQEWTGTTFTTSGTYEVAGALQPVKIDIESNQGIYYDLAVWVRHYPEKFSDGQLNVFNPRNAKDFLSGILPPYMVPAVFAFISYIPLTPNGKVDRKKLPTVTAIDTAERVNYTAPRDEIEKKLVTIWSEILGKVTGIDDNFFDLGGHSLKATVLVSNIHKELHVKVPLGEIFKTPSIRVLSRYIRNAPETRFISLKPVEKREYYKPSAAQKRLYAIHQLETHTSYNIPQVVMIEGNLDPQKLEEAIDKLIARHESFRTSFHVIHDESVQRIHDQVNFGIDFYNSGRQGDRETGTLLKSNSLIPGSSPKTPISLSPSLPELFKNFIRPFDLSHAPLMRVGLINMAEKKHILIIDMHHIITDGVSDEIFVSDFVALYRGEELSDLRLQYKDYSGWQNSKEQQELLKKQEEYWVQRFADKIPALNLPLDYPRPVVQAFDGNLLEFQLPGKLTGALNEFIKQEKDITLYMVLMAAFNVLLARYSGQEDIVVGFPITGRTHADLKNIIGMFVNMLALRNQPGPAKTFREFLEEVKTNARNAYANQDYPYGELVERLGIRRNPGKNPLFDCVFSFYKIDEMETKDIQMGTGLKLSPYRSGHRTSKFDLQLRGAAGGDVIALALESKTGLFKQETIAGMQRHFIEILEQVIEDMNMKIGDIVFSSDLVFGVPVNEAEQVDFSF